MVRIRDPKIKRPAIVLIRNKTMSRISGCVYFSVRPGAVTRFHIIKVRLSLFSVDHKDFYYYWIKLVRFLSSGKGSMSVTGSQIPDD